MAIGVRRFLTARGPFVTDPFAPVKGKCTWWRESAVDEDRWATRIKEDDKRVNCSCFVEGKGWTFARRDVPAECPDSRHCRYYIRHL